MVQYIDTRQEENKNQWLELQGTLGFLFQLTDRKGWIQQSNPWSSYCSMLLKSGFTVAFLILSVFVSYWRFGGVQLIQP